jgi:hypothetical protein
MKQVSENLVAIIAGVLKGAKLKKFMESVTALNDSLARGGWVCSSSKVESGFYQGLCKVGGIDVKVCSAEWYASNDVGRLLNYGLWGNIVTEVTRSGKPLPYPNTEIGVFELGIKTIREHIKLKVSNEVIVAWYRLVKEKEAAISLLDDARPLPKITPIGLSPKVAATLNECNLDLDLQSIQMAKIAFYFVQAKQYDKVKEEWLPIILADGSYLLGKEYYVVWTEGIIHNQSRFAGRYRCEACGKAIPSGRFVPVEAFDNKKRQLISMWLGCDCARNIFGIKDEGIKQS